jgi:hypothetical protein
MKFKTYNGEARSSEKDFETLELGAFATPGLLLAHGPVRFNCGIRVLAFTLTRSNRAYYKRDVSPRVTQ